MAGFGLITLKLVRRVSVVNATGTLADWRISCEVSTVLKQFNVMNAPDTTRRDHLPLTTYQEMIRELSVLLRSRYMVFTTMKRCLTHYASRYRSSPRRTSAKICMYATMHFKLVVCIGADRADSWPS